MLKLKKTLTTLLAVGFVLGGLEMAYAANTIKHVKLDTDSNGAAQHAYTENLNDQNFDAVLAENPVVIVDFYADWCAPCRRFLPVFEQVAKEMYGSLTFGKLNTDHAPNTLKRYKVSSIPTVIIFKDGKEVKRRNGGCDAETLKAFINSVL